MVDVAKIGYYFTVQSQNYRGDRVSTFDLRLGRNTERAKSLLARYPVGTQVEVSYDPSDPNRSVLEPGPKDGALMMVAVGFGLLALPFALKRIV